TFHNGAWSTMTSNTTNNIVGVYQDAIADAYVIQERVLSNDPALLHWTGGASWTPVTTIPIPTPAAVWASGPNDVYVGGDALAHWDGSHWSYVGLGASDVTSISGSSASNVYVAYFNGTVAHFDGAAWSFSQLTTATEAVAAIWTGGAGIAVA